MEFNVMLGVLSVGSIASLYFIWLNVVNGKWDRTFATYFGSKHILFKAPGELRAIHMYVGRVLGGLFFYLLAVPGIGFFGTQIGDELSGLIALLSICIGVYMMITATIKASRVIDYYNYHNSRPEFVAAETLVIDGDTQKVLGQNEKILFLGTAEGALFALAASACHLYLPYLLFVTWGGV